MRGRYARSLIVPEHPAHGRFRIFTRTDGKLVVYDPERRWDDRAVAVFPGDALRAAQLYTERACAGAST